MILDSLSEIKEENNVVIIGSGPAGISVALQLEKKGIPSIIFEAGNLDYDEKSQSFYKGTVIGDEYPDLTVSRLRQFGGTSGHWGGNCLELDSYDFEKWPISKKDLEPYKKISYEILNIKGNFYKKTFNENFDLFNLNWSNIRFREKYFEDIRKSKKISLILNCPLLMLNGTNGIIKSAVFKKDIKKKINSKYFVIAAGGIENSRLLLWIKQNNKNFFNDKLPIGKYWMDHPYHSVAEGIIFYDKFHEYLSKSNIKNYFDLNCNYAFYLTPKKEFLNKFSLLNTSLNIGIRQIDREYKNDFFKKLKCIAPNIIKNNLFIKNSPKDYKFSISLLKDQNPTLENKVILSNDKDDLGIPKPILYWKRSENVRRSSKIIVENFAQFLVSNNLGRLAANQFLFNKESYNHENGYHHIGGTRMGENIIDSVVDKNCKVHQTQNLFVTGSSVFSTAGHAYPTLTITQISLRLGNHIANLKS
jgi:hypothetical protein